MKMKNIFDQAAQNAGFENIEQLVRHAGKPSRIVELMRNSKVNPENCILATEVFKYLSKEMQDQIKIMPTEEQRVACAAYLADDLDEVIEFEKRLNKFV